MQYYPHIYIRKISSVFNHGQLGIFCHGQLGKMNAEYKQHRNEGFRVALLR